MLNESRMTFEQMDKEVYQKFQIRYSYDLLEPVMKKHLKELDISATYDMDDICAKPIRVVVGQAKKFIEDGNLLSKEYKIFLGMITGLDASISEKCKVNFINTWKEKLIQEFSAAQENQIKLSDTAVENVVKEYYAGVKCEVINVCEDLKPNIALPIESERSIVKKYITLLQVILKEITPKCAQSIEKQMFNTYIEAQKEGNLSPVYSFSEQQFLFTKDECYLVANEWKKDFEQKLEEAKADAVVPFIGEADISSEIAAIYSLSQF